MGGKRQGPGGGPSGAAAGSKALASQAARSRSAALDAHCLRPLGLPRRSTQEITGKNKGAAMLPLVGGHIRQ